MIKYLTKLNNKFVKRKFYLKKSFIVFFISQNKFNMNLRSIHFVGVVLILFTIAECATVIKSTNNSTIVDQENDLTICTKITTQEKCLQSPCVWCGNECIEEYNLSMFQGKSSNCLADEEYQLKYGAALFWIIGGVILGFCCCGCFCCGCFLG